ncbi:hypothetical protein BG000_006725 [Podila horticola]|nr:hypothetical protein BG000_006725 [Podila horticola]
MENPIASSRTTSGMNIASTDKSCQIATTATSGALQEPKLPTRSSSLSPLASSFVASAHPSSPPAMVTSDSVSNMRSTTIIHSQPRIFDSMQVLPDSNPVLPSSVIFSTEVTPPLRALLQSPQNQTSLSRLRPNLLTTTTDGSPLTPESLSLELALRRPMFSSLTPSSKTKTRVEVSRKHQRRIVSPSFCARPSVTVWAVLALYVERDIDSALSRFSGLEGRLISDYRDHTPRELGELVAETVKDEKEEMTEL